MSRARMDGPAWIPKSTDLHLRRNSAASKRIDPVALLIGGVSALSMGGSWLRLRMRPAWVWLLELLFGWAVGIVWLAGDFGAA